MRDNETLMTFIDQSESFALGFECGLMWQKMDAGESFTKYVFHRKNEKEVEKMCRRFHYRYLLIFLNDEWSELTANRSPQAN